MILLLCLKSWKEPEKELRNKKERSSAWWMNSKIIKKILFHKFVIVFESFLGFLSENFLKNKQKLRCDQISWSKRKKQHKLQIKKKKFYFCFIISKMNVTIKTLYGRSFNSFCILLWIHSNISFTGKTYEYTVEKDDFVVGLKQRIEIDHGLPVGQIRLVYDGQILDDEKTMEDHNVKDNSDFHLILNLRGD